MALPDVETAYDDLVKRFHGATGAVNIATQYYPPILTAAAAVEAARITEAAAADLRAPLEALKESMDKFTASSDRSTNRVADWTKWLVIATSALVLSSVVQILVMWSRP